MRQTKIRLSIPTYSQELYFETTRSIIDTLQTTENAEIHVEFASISALTFNFNKLLYNAYYSDCDYWVLLHADLAAKQRDWLTILINEMKAEGLGVISAVSAIKSFDGLTSVALDTREHFPRRLTLTEIQTGPAVLTNEKAKRLYGNNLLINTGMMVWDMGIMRKHVPDLPFEFHDGWYMNLTEQGEVMCPYFHPEDWIMSQKLDKLGIPFGTTRSVHTLHKGTFVFDSSKTWGDPQDRQWLNSKE